MVGGGRKRRSWHRVAPIGSAEKLEIDSKIRSLPLQARWKSVDEAVSFGRLALQVASEDAVDGDKYRVGGEFNYFDRTFELAEYAHEPLRKLLEHIGQTGVDTTINHVCRVPKSLAKSGKLRLRGKNLADPDFSKERVQILASACTLLDEIRSYARRRKELLKHTRINEPDHGKHMFVYRLAEAWIFLTGKRPGRGRHCNPFLRFVEAAAIDVGAFEADEDFYSALAAALKNLNELERWLDGTNNHQTISGIATLGPSWG